ncbi:MAG TPA: hypothetical protein VN861_15075 [Candidatus Acidoferrales bacterium]|nr:hypothetical protein [Candidatus Acidoferrales bacterium]
MLRPAKILGDIYPSCRPTYAGTFPVLTDCHRFSGRSMLLPYAPSAVARALP